jgi:hypothetical protein
MNHQAGHHRALAHGVPVVELFRLLGARSNRLRTACINICINSSIVIGSSSSSSSSSIFSSASSPHMITMFLINTNVPFVSFIEERYPKWPDIN